MGLKMAFTSKQQIEQAKKNIEAQLKLLEQEEKDFEAKAEGFKLIEAEKEKYHASVKKIAEKFKITDEEVKAMNSPKPLIVFEYETLFNGIKTPKSYEWYMGKIGKAPNEFELKKSEGADSMKLLLTEAGKEWISTTKGQGQFAWFMLSTEQKKAIGATDKKEKYFM